jgi:hypothetical protein
MKMSVAPSTARTLCFTLIYSCLIFFSQLSFSQTGIVALSPQEAIAESNALSGSFGFSQVYFSKNDINQMLQQEGSAGVRFYTVRQSGFLGFPGSPSVMAVAVRSDGTEIGSYLRMDGYSSDALDQSSARSELERSYNSGFATTAATFSGTDLSGSIMQESGDGLHIKPGHDGSNNSMIIVASNRTSAGSNDEGTSYFRAAQPCPPDCSTGFLMNLN